MQFKNPEILYALFLLLIPILIHLFQLRRYKKTPFTNVVFLQNIIQNTRKSSSLKKWLVLFTRLIALACLIFAFAQPYFPVTEQAAKPKETVVFIDNSFSMQAPGKKGDLLTEATQDLLANSAALENATLVTWDAVLKDFNPVADRDFLLDLDFSPTVTDSKSLFLKLNTLFSNSDNTAKQLLFISDFQNVSLDNTLDSLGIAQFPVILKPVSLENFALDSISLSRNGDFFDLKVMLNSTMASETEIPISLYDHNKLIAKASAQFESRDTTSVNFQLPTDKAIRGRLSIDDAYLKYDNSFYFSINKLKPLKVLAISNAEDDFLKRLYRSSNFEFTSVLEKQLDYSLLENQNVIILNELSNIPPSLVNLLKTHTKKGGNLVLIPAMNAKPDSYSNLLETFGYSSFTEVINEPKLLSVINYDHPLYRNVFNGKSSNLQSHIVESYFKLANTNAILNLENGDPFLTEKNRLYTFTAALSASNSNFINGQLIVPTFDKIALEALSLPEIYYTLGRNAKFDITATLPNDATLLVEKNGNQFIPLQEKQSDKISVSTSEGIFADGLYAVTYKQDTLATVAFNYNRIESRLIEVGQNENTLSYTSTIKTLFNKLEQESDLNLFYKWFVIFALLAFLIEMLLLKFLK